MMNFEGKTCVINYHSDLSGNIIISPKIDIEYEVLDKGGEDNSFEVSGEDILDFVAEYVRSKRISELEQMDTQGILNG